MRKFMLALLFLVGANAIAAFDASLVGVANITTPNGTLALNNKVGIGFGGLVSLDVAPMMSLEAGILSVSRKFSIPGVNYSGEVNPTYKYGYLMIPILARWGLVDMLTFGVGGYYATALGDVNIELPSGRDFVENYSTHGIDASDFGLAASAQLKLPVAPTLSLLADARYLFGLKSIDSFGGKWRDLQFLVGLNFGI